MDGYPEDAKRCCEGFLDLYSKDTASVPTPSGTKKEPSKEVVCVASCLINKEKDKCQFQDKCADRNSCRYQAHLDCYRECSFIPYAGMPLPCAKIAPVVIGVW